VLISDDVKQQTYQKLYTVRRSIIAQFQDLTIIGASVISTPKLALPVDTTNGRELKHMDAGWFQMRLFLYQVSQ
jgi:hypothetical protein